MSTLSHATNHSKSRYQKYQYGAFHIVVIVIVFSFQMQKYKKEKKTTLSIR